jgi:hypothetical protein
MQHAIPLSHYQADDKMLPLSAVGNKDIRRCFQENNRFFQKLCDLWDAVCHATLVCSVR